MRAAGWAAGSPGQSGFSGTGTRCCGLGLALDGGGAALPNGGNLIPGPLGRPGTAQGQAHGTSQGGRRRQGAWRLVLLGEGGKGTEGRSS